MRPRHPPAVSAPNGFGFLQHRSRKSLRWTTCPSLLCWRLPNGRLVAARDVVVDEGELALHLLRQPMLHGPASMPSIHLSMPFRRCPRSRRNDVIMPTTGLARTHPPGRQRPPRTVSQSGPEGFKATSPYGRRTTPLGQVRDLFHGKAEILRPALTHPGNGEGDVLAARQPRRPTRTPPRPRRPPPACRWPPRR